MGNLPTGTSETSLSELFSRCGAVSSCKVIQRAKGTCGLVLFEEVAAAAVAVQQMHDAQIEGVCDAHISGERVWTDLARSFKT